MSDVFRNLDWSSLVNTAVLSIIPALICITFHELSHGFVAYKLGDRTAKDMGRLTLNPIKHIDIFGLLMMVVFGFGWAKPVPVNMRNFKKPKRDMAITALAGPVANLILACIFFAIYGAVYTALLRTSAGAIVLQMILRTAYLNVALAIFNVIPIPPLDGSKVLFSLLPDRNYYQLMRYERYGMIVLLILVYSNFIGTPLANITMSVYNFFANIANGVHMLVG